MHNVIIHQHDPTLDCVGGIQTLINNSIKHAPPGVEISVVGVTTDRGRYPLGQWHRIRLGERSCRFLPVLEAHPVLRSRIPLSLRFTWAVLRQRHLIDTKGVVLTFHRLEPSLAFVGVKTTKILFIHGNMQDLYNPKTEILWGRFPWLYFGLERLLIQSLDRLYAPRPDTINFYRIRYPQVANKVQLFTSWIDEDIFMPLPEPDRLRQKETLAKLHQLDSRKPWILFVGRFEGQKDPLFLLEAFHRQNGRLRGVQLIMVGEGSLESEIRAFILHQGLGSSVRLVGVQSQSQIAQWMNSAQCLCMSSAFEGLPLVLIEALSCGLPLVVRDTLGVQRLFKDPRVGKLVVENTPEALGEAITDVLQGGSDRKVCCEEAQPYRSRAILAEIYSDYRKLAGVW